jgi:hypothetical protein
MSGDSIAQGVGRIPNAMLLVNPLGLTITYFRVDQAFQ